MSKSVEQSINPYNIIKTITKEVYLQYLNSPSAAYNLYEEIEQSIAKEDYQLLINQKIEQICEYIKKIKLVSEYSALVKENLSVNICSYVDSFTFATIEYEFNKNSTGIYKNENDEIFKPTTIDSELDCLTMHNFMLYEIDIRIIQLLKDNLPESLISQDEFKEAEELLAKYEQLEIVRQLYTPNLEKKFNDNIAEQLIEAAEKINDHVSDGDIVIFVGNTPQMIRYPFEKISFSSKTALKSFSLAISGHPGKIYLDPNRVIQADLKNALTLNNHKLYKEYLTDMGLTKEVIEGKKIHFVDIVGQGGGISYLMQSLAEIAYNSDLQHGAPYMNVIATNSPRGNEFLKDGKFKANGYEATTTAICLNMDTLSNSLDKIDNANDNCRLMPNAKAYLFGESSAIDTFKEASYSVLTPEQNLFKEIYGNIDEILPSVDVAFIQAVKRAFAFNFSDKLAEADQQKIAKILEEHFSGEVFTEKHHGFYLACTGEYGSFWQDFLEQAACKHNPEGYHDLAATLVGGVIENLI